MRSKSGFEVEQSNAKLNNEIISFKLESQALKTSRMSSITLSKTPPEQNTFAEETFQTELVEEKRSPKQAWIGIQPIKPIGLAELRKKPVFNKKHHLLATLAENEKTKIYLAQDIQKPGIKSVIKVWHNPKQ